MTNGVVIAGPELSSEVQGFERTLWLGVTILCLLAAGFGGYAIHASRLNHIERARTATQNLALVLEAEVAGIFDYTDLALRNLADQYADILRDNKLPVDKWNADLQRQRSDQKILGGIRATDSAGTIAFGLSPGDARNVSIADRDYFITHRDNPSAGLLVSRPVLSRITKTWSIVLSRRLSDSRGRFAGIVATTIPLNLLTERFASLKLGKQGSVGLRDGNLRLMVRYPELPNGGSVGSTIVADEFRAALQLNNSLGSYHAGATSIDGIQRFHSYRRNGQYDFYINVGGGEDDYLAVWRTDALSAVSVLGIFLLATVIFAFLIRRAWRQSQSLTRQLSNSELRFRKMFQHNDSVMLLIEPELGVIADANPAASNFYGYPIERLKMMRINEINTLAADEVAAMRASAAHHEQNLFVFPHRLADGEVRTVEVYSSPVEVDGRPLLFSIVHDITERKRLESELADRERHLATLIAATPVGVYETDAMGNCTFVNSRWCEITGLSEEMARSEGWADALHPEDKGKVIAIWASAIAESRPFQLEYRFLRPNGKIAWVLGQSDKLLSGTGELQGYIGTITNITELKQAEAKLQLAASVFAQANEGITITDADGTIIDVNGTFTLITGYERDEVIGKNPRLLKSGRQGPEFYASMWSDLTKDGRWSGEIWNRRKNGEVYAEMLTISAVPDETGKTKQYVGLFSDISERKRIEDQVHKLAFYDSLTTLPNRRLLSDRLQQSMAANKRSGCYGALMFLDLDNFKPLNDVQGHEAGDLLLIEAAGRLKRCVREMDTVARFGGDEFVVMISELSGDKAEATTLVAAVAEKVRVALSEPYLLTIQRGDKPDIRIEHHCTASIGVALFVNHETSQDNIIKWADTAMYQAKKAGRNMIRFYESTD